MPFHLPFHFHVVLLLSFWTAPMAPVHVTRAIRSQLGGLGRRHPPSATGSASADESVLEFEFELPPLGAAWDDLRAWMLMMRGRIEGGHRRSWQ